MITIPLRRSERCPKLIPWKLKISLKKTLNLLLMTFSPVKLSVMHSSTFGGKCTKEITSMKKEKLTA